MKKDKGNMGFGRAWISYCGGKKKEVARTLLGGSVKGSFAI